MGVGFLDLGCGCGGASVGFKEAGYEPILAYDGRTPCLRTYRLNHKDIPVFKELDAALLRAVIPFTNGIFIFSSPYCPLAVDRLVLDSMRIMNIGPLVFVKEYLKSSCDLLDGLDLRMTVNYGDYGLPQYRLRTWFIRSDVKFCVNRLIDKLEVVKVRSVLPDTSINARKGAKVSNRRNALSYSKQASTLNTKFSRSSAGFVHPSGLRCLNLEEGLLLQSFSPTYKFECGINEWTKQVGQATPPIIAKLLASVFNFE